ncbi:MAG: phage antirepressor N-terminal domain-containing protein, partial [Cetobacterium sp.]
MRIEDLKNGKLSVEVKEVEFDGKKILGIMENGKIYVSVKAVCNGLGMSKGQYDAQLRKVNGDELLKG